MIKIITDTASDITLKQANQMDITVLPISIAFDEGPYNQFEDEEFTQFYEKLESSEKSPTTSLISPGEYLDFFEKAKENGDSVIVIPISSKLSGSFQSAELAKNMSEYDNIHIIDAHQVVIGQRLLVEHAVRLRDEKKSVEEIVAAVTDVSKRIRLYAKLDTLKYLVKGGRISKTAGFMGTTLNIKPLVSLQNGSVSAVGKARGRDGANKALLKFINNDFNPDPAFPFCFGYTSSRELMDVFADLAITELKLSSVNIYPIGGVIGTHVGPSGVAAVWVEK
ncbi:MAG: DegV family protein [Defluviitaleaceae bacterium]|nr:DegV family protein [Defluviitaleaceae bacterium]